MRTTFVAVIFTLMASGAMSMAVQADNAAAQAIEARALEGATENRLDSRMIRTGSGRAAAANAEPESPKPLQTCDIHLTWGEGYLDYKEYVAQAKSLCSQLGGRYPGKSDLTGAVRCTEVPGTVERVGKVTATLRGGQQHKLQYSCLGH
ncbi:hypothetical protein PspLS_00299 [Pyricularia sp. CBS 133598]|nr:hypothetical protein PspLS_00299 [Pyricularia sp. CBS 133598]